jgi:tetratricopeptide (TPR) repeat protein
MSGLARAQALLAAHRPEEALTELATLPPVEAIGRPAALLRCYALMGLDRWPEAGIAARAGLAENGPDPDLLYVLGRAEQAAGHLEVAERALLDGLAMAPHDVDLLCGYAELCAANNQSDKAAKLVARAQAEDPESARVFAARIQVAHARGDDRAAQRIAQEFVAVHPENPAAHGMLGGMSAVRGQIDPAYAGMRQAAASAPGEQGYAESAMELRIAKHPLMLPVRPVIRFGPLKTWVAAIVLIYGLRLLGLPALSFAAALIWLVLCVYSWVVPPLLRRWMLRHWR